MSPMAKNEYFETMRVRYRKARGRKEKSQLLDEICATCRCHRKHAVRALHRRRSSGDEQMGKRGPKRSYQSKELLRSLKIIWLAANLPCSKRLKVILPLWMSGYEKEFGKLPNDVKSKLLSISPSTIDRLMLPVRIKHSGRGRTTTKPGTLLRRTVPIKTGQWDETRPGFVEADTVAHCGTSMAGQFAWTVDVVDIATGWTEQRAVWAKQEKKVVEQIRSIEKAMPFALLGFDSDNGGEFLNHSMLEFCFKRHKPVQFTRSRAYRKNDNAHIEQKNWTHVRQWLGYDRLDAPEVIALMNELYENEWRLFHNFYCPSVKLVSKERIGSKVIKTHDVAKTPYQRTLESKHISDYNKRGLQSIFENTNPFLLRRRMEERLKKIFSAMNTFNKPKPGDIR